ncbi:MAG: ATP-binding protein [Polyangia bacterium]
MRSDEDPTAMQPFAQETADATGEAPDAFVEAAGVYMAAQMQRVRTLLRRHQLLFPDRYGGEAGDPDPTELADAEAAVAQATATAQEVLETAWSAGHSLPLRRLREALGLVPAEEELLCTLYAAEAEPELYRAFQRGFDHGARQGDVAFFVELLGGRGATRAPYLRALSPTSTLARHGLISLSSDHGWQPRTPPMYLRVRLGGRVSGFLRGEIRPAARGLPHAVSFYRSDKPLKELRLPPGTVERLHEALLTTERAPEGDGTGAGVGTDRAAHELGRGFDPLALYGPRRSGRKALLSAMLPEVPLVVINTPQAPKAEEAFEQLLREALCEAALQGGVLYFDNGEALLTLEPPLQARLLELLAGVQVRMVLALDGTVDGLWELFPRAVRVDLAMPDPVTQSALWVSMLPPDVQLEPSFDLQALTMNYSLPAGAIHRCADELVRAARVMNPRQPVIAMTAARESVRKQLGNRFGDLAQLVTTTLSWNDLVLPSDVLDRVLEVVAYAKYREQLLGAWGFERKLPYGRSISVLFAGPPGTGKTMVSALVAKEIGLELFRVNVSRVVDKYIGETEKNLARIFDEARRGQVALLFDEADSLFGKRTEVKSSTDRYSNLAINYLLQAVESHDGMIILTTNHEKAMDEAFRRRLRFRITVPLPGEAERAMLWRSMLPKEAHREEEIDWTALAREFDIAGGSIKNAVVRAALRAIATGAPISTDLLRHGARLECEEMGILVVGNRTEAGSLLE